ncbi:MULTISPECIES: hypothetical protein [unclassified Rhodococcus (in: high G+C Gram-positive bacteria)]|uniref:hypothetical protein n=1 Tax=unclassified Rhodococcus (in: high G+C Gram-positive bacteria) TaxID=192944 RepID=UPI0002A1F9BC|nr:MULTISPECIES: hypothetical protein [unclassified Rhodococcus (in: high G+C Gram-positive bacteria)]ELB93240.1 hypothetical protein Rwratislav_09993 [Rhodococcus wratislaviensis IFP 2016]MBC2644950.1 hypothetical protein [Rhodococcus sp. 3A]MBC2898025.1 hypothetical protein [Rhodococcus sp. 4CII]
MSDERTTGEVIKNFTRARKVPQLIGRTPEGQKLPFGPYTVPQAVSGAIVGGLLWLLHPLWLRDSISWNVGFFAFWSLGTVLVVGKLRFAGRSPASVAQGICAAAFAPAGAKIQINGRRVTIRPPHIVRPSGYITADPTAAELSATVVPQAVHIATAEVTETASAKPVAPRPQTSAPVPTPASGPTHRAGRSSVKELLALAAAGTSE